ncbi:hypothetical protein C8Q70DRAFT_982551 [Cubamyces menziesii]|nr:hypothetical protein C8Q70DRAFT_982551 [Cubamyces menziesii]
MFSQAFRSLGARARPHVVSAFGLGGLFLNPSRHSNSSATGYLLRTPPPSAPREVPTPLVFVSASSWDASSRKGSVHHRTLRHWRGGRFDDLGLVGSTCWRRGTRNGGIRVSRLTWPSLRMRLLLKHS